VRVGRWLVTLFLALDGVDTVVWIGGVIPEVHGLGGLALALVISRGLVGSIEGTSAWLRLRGERPARVLSIVGLVGAAILTTLIVGLGLAPSDTPPGTREIVVAVYWAAAVAGIALPALATVP
jgi:hypothetical protein